MNSYGSMGLSILALDYREGIANQFLDGAVLNLDKFASVNAFLSESLDYWTSVPKKKEKIDLKKLETFLSWYNLFGIGRESDKEAVSQEWANCFVKNGQAYTDLFQNPVLSAFSDSLSKFKFFFKTEWIEICNAYGSLANFFFEKSAMDYLHENIKDYSHGALKARLSRPGKKIKKSLESDISTYLPTVLSLGNSLQRDRTFTKIFDLNTFCEICLDPRVLLYINDIAIENGAHVGYLARVKEKTLIKLLSSRCKLKEDVTRDLLSCLIHGTASCKFPLIIRDGNYLLVSPKTNIILFFYTIFCLFRNHPSSLVGKLMNSKVNELAFEFEDEVSGDLIKYGCTIVKRNLNIKTPLRTEIDILATLGNKLLIIDCKNWGLTPEYFYYGKNKTRSDEIISQKRKMSARQQWVEDNLPALGLKGRTFVYRQLIIMKGESHLPTRGVGDMKIISQDQIADFLKQYSTSS